MPSPEIVARPAGELEAFSLAVLALRRLAREPGALEDALAECARLLGAVSGVIALFDGEEGSRFHLLQFHSSVAGMHEPYVSRHAGRDPVRDALLAAEPLRVYPMDDLVPASERSEDPFFTQWYASLGFCDVLLARLPVQGGRQCLWGFMRRVEEGPFGVRERDLMQQLLPHLVGVLSLHASTQQEWLLGRLAERQLRHRGHGVAVLDQYHRIVYSNDTALPLLRDRELFRMDGGTIEVHDPAAAVRFGELLRRCVAVSRSASMLAGGWVALPRAGAPAVAVGVLPYRRNDEARTVVATTSRAVLILCDPARPLHDTRASLRALYGLSAAEAEVCWRIGCGETLAQIAQDLGSSRETVRSQLKRLFAKTGTNRQSELVRLLLLGPVGWAPD